MVIAGILTYTGFTDTLNYVHFVCNSSVLFLLTIKIQIHREQYSFRYLLPRIIKCEVIVIFASGFLFILKKTGLNVTLFPSSVPFTILPPSLGNQYYNVCILPAFVIILYYLITYIYIFICKSISMLMHFKFSL